MHHVLEKLKVIEAGADHFSVLEIPSSASSADVKIAYFKLAKTFHPDRIASLKLELVRPHIERIFARMSEAFSLLTDEGKRAEYKKVQAAGGEEAVRRKEQEDEARALRILDAEEHFRNGELALKRGQFGMALTEFQAALDGNPEESEHHAMLAWATFTNASDKNSVLSHVKAGFARALELNDACVPAYFYLGHVYVFTQDLPRAMGQFQRALDLRPSYIEAERELRLLQSRQQKGGGKGGSLNPFKKR
jgi:curved DNA-binding protein CbpA